MSPTKADAKRRAYSSRLATGGFVKSANIHLVESSRRPTPPTTSVDNPRICIAVVDPYSFTRACITRSLQIFGDDVEIVSYSNYEECRPSSCNPNIILYHAATASNERGWDTDCLEPLRVLQKVAPVVVLATIEDRKFLIKVIEAGACGFIPTASTTPEGLIEIIRVVVTGRIRIFPGGPVREAFQSVNENRTSPMDITPAPMAITPEQFTPREREVLNRLKVGKSNKIIAYELNMSESTVKVHIARIMRKINATNRTEVVYRTRHLAAIDLGE